MRIIPAAHEKHDCRTEHRQCEQDFPHGRSPGRWEGAGEPEVGEQRWQPAMHRQLPFVQAHVCKADGSPSRIVIKYTDDALECRDSGNIFGRCQATEFPFFGSLNSGI